MLMENPTFMIHFPLFMDAVTFKPIQEPIDEKLACGARNLLNSATLILLLRIFLSAFLTSIVV